MTTAPPQLAARRGTLGQDRVPVRALTMCLLLTLLALGSLGYSVSMIYHVTQYAASKDLELKELEGVIRHLDEVLTMSARMAAATGDRKWEVRYRSFEPVLDRAIKQVTRLAPEAFTSHAAEQMDEANLKLVEMEYRAFGLVHDGKTPEAQAVLFSDAYEAEKRRYADALEHVSARVKELGQARTGRTYQIVLVNLAAIAVILVLVIAGWLAVLRILRRWHAALAKKNQELNELNVSLDQRVLERTHDVEHMNQQLRETANIVF